MKSERWRWWCEARCDEGDGGVAWHCEKVAVVEADVVVKEEVVVVVLM